MDINSRDPSQNIIPFRIKGVDVGRFDTSGNLGIGTITPTATLEVVGTVKINGNAAITGNINMSNNATSGLNNIDAGFTLNGLPIESKTTVVVNMDSQPVAATTLNRQKKQSIPLASASTLTTSDIVAKMSGVSVGKTQSYGVGASQMASYGNIVVAVGEGTNSIAYSLVNPPTASSWVGIPNSSNTFTSRGWNIAYANGTWVAVGEGTNSIAYSTMTPPVASSWVGIPTGSSFNGVTTTFNTRARDIAYGNGVWVVCGDGPNTSGTNTIAYSLANPPTAESWVGIPNSTGSNFGSAGFGITFGNGTWVATGQGTNAFAYSTRTPPTFDSWITVPLNNTNDAGNQNVFNTNAFNVIYANGVWLAAGNGDNTLCYSVENPPIAGSWMPITRSSLFGGAVCWSVAYGNGTWVASASSTTIFAYSTARIPHSSSWVVMRGPTPSSSGEQINHITFNAATNTWYFLCDVGTNCMFYSTQTPPVPASWVGVQRSAGAFTTQAYGAVGITTNAFTSPMNVARLDNKVTFPANRILAVGGGGAEVLARSSNTPTPATTGTISYSDDDGATWQMVPGGATNAMFSSQADIVAGTSFGVGGSRGANAVAWNGEKWVAAGNGRMNSLAFSDDGGMTWTGITSKSIFSVEARDVAWNGRMWVAVGRGIQFSTAYSYDGISWMGPVDASGTPVNVFSFTIAGPTAAMSDISGGGNHVIWTGKMWVATGTRTLIAGSSPAAYYTIAYSMDGKSWIGVPESGATSTGFDMYAHGVAWNGRNYIATGRGTANTLAFSTDVTSWQGMGNTVFSVWGRGITWGAKRWMATGRGTNTVAYSTNGRNWQGCGANVFKPMRRFMAMGDTGLYTTVSSGQPQRGVAFSYSDDGVTWDAPVVNQAVENSGELSLYTFTSHTFTNAGATGRTGPTLSAVRSAYSSATWAQNNNFLSMTSDNGIQLWTVPVTGFYNIVCSGAAGGAIQRTSSRGRGIVIRSIVQLNKGVRLFILVGQLASIYTDSNATGGGGGTFIAQGTTLGDTTPIIVAGGGGGAGNGDNAKDAVSVSTGQDGDNNSRVHPGIGQGGADARDAGQGAGGAGGFYSNGESGSQYGSQFGYGFRQGGAGGISSNGDRLGGFGGGAGTHSNNTSGGAGGGYSGGSAPYHGGSYAGGGGSSYSTGSLTVDGYNTGHGYVTITLVSSLFGIPVTIFTNNILLTNAITDNTTQHTALMYSTDAGSSWARVPGTSDTEANGGTGMTVANGGSYSLAMNTSRTRFLVGSGDAASATRKVYFSNDGFNWRNGVSSPNSTQMAWVWASMWVGGGYNRWLVGGSDASNNNNGRIMYSGDADAVAAWLAASPATYTGTIISCFAANANFSVILAGSLSGNVILRSENGGATWTTVNISTTPTGSVNSIAFSPSLGRWIAVGGGSNAANTIIYSTDATGNTWVAPAAQAKAAATAIFKIGSEVTRVIWDAVGGRFLIGGWNGGSAATLTNVAGLNNINNNTGCTIAYSSDGIVWTPVTVRSDTGTATGFSPGASTFGPFLTQCREIMALDMSGDFTPINTGYSVTWNSYANRFIATGNGTTPVVYSSDGGVTWIPANQQPQQQAIAVAGGLGTSASTSSSSVSHITYTIDGKTWSQGIGVKEIFGTGTVLALRYGQTSTAISPNGRIWVAGGTPTSGTSCLAFSQNGVRWTAIAGGNTMITNVRTIAYAPPEQMIAVPGVNNNVNNALTTATSGVGNGVWVAGGDTTNSLVFSYDGISWSEVPNSLTILSTCNACAFGNGLFVAGGNASSSNPIDSTANMAYSTDGINWQPIRGSRTRVSNNASISCITYGRDENGRGLWVAGVTGSLAASVSILHSYNGIDWIGVPGSGNLVINVTGIAYGQSTSTGQGLWIASVRNAGYSFVFSTNGRDGWTSVSNTKSGLFELSGSGATNITYFNGVWYATGISAGINTTNPPGRTLAYSYEGTSGWFGVYPTSNMYGSAITTFSATDMRCVATTAEYSIPCGSSAGLTTSAGTAASSGIPSSLVPVRSLGWTAGIGSTYLQHPILLFGADSSRTSTTSTVISADGGRTWGSSTVSLSRSAFRGGVCNDAFWNGTIWAAVGFDAVTGAKVATSRDGLSWTQIPAGNVPITGILYSIMWNGTIWMVGGDGSPTDDAFTASIAWSSDLITWNAITNTDTKLTITKRIAWNGMYWVAVGAGDVSTIMHSRDTRGFVWEDTFLSSSSTNKTASIISVVNDVVWGGGRWVAVGRGNSIGGGSGVSILYSADTPVSGGIPAEYAITGRRWTGVAGSAQLFPYGANSISWNGKRFVVTGPASGTCCTSNIIAWSADGISWNAYSTTKTVAPGQRWVAVGSGSRASIALSGDGRVWTDVSGSALFLSDISGASAALVNTMKTGGRAIGWNGNSLVVGGARSATTVTATSQFTATSTIGRTTIPICAFIGSGNGVMGGGTTNSPMDNTAASYLRTSSSVFITHLDVNIREGSAPWSNMWLNTYTDLSGTQLFQVTPEAHTFSSALKWNGWSWVANFGLTTNNPITGEQYGSIWYCTDPLARVGWSVASNYATPRILIGHGGYAALEWNGVAWLACGYDPNNNNLIYTTDKYGAIGWTAITGLVSGTGSSSFQPVCIASSSRFWVVGGSQGSTSAMYYTSDRTGATGWRAIVSSVLPGIRITSIGYNGSAWICCGGGGGGSGAPASSISWRADADDIGRGWAAATISGTSGGFPPVLSGSSAVAYNAGAASPIWIVVGDVTSNSIDQVAFTSTVNGSTEWKKPAGSFNLTNTTFGRLNGIAWTGYSWIATSGAGASRIANTTDITSNVSQWNSIGIFSPTLCTNAVAYVNIPISLLTTGMPTSAGIGAGTGAMWRGGVGRAQGLLPAGGTETTSVVVRSENGAEGTRWSQVYSRNFLIAVGGGIIRDSSNDGGTNRMAYSYDGGLTWITNNTLALTNRSNFGPGSIRTVKYGNGMWVAGGDSTNTPAGSNSLAWSRDGINWTGAGGTQIFGTNGSCYAVCCNDRGRWVAVGGAQLTTAGTYTNTSGAIYTMAWSDDGMNWTPVLGSRALFGIVCQGVTYGADASGVGMWTAIGRGTTYTGCAYSYDGKNWYLSQTSASLFGTSANVLTERYSPVASASWHGVAMSSTGQYQSAVIDGGFIYTSYDYGITWTARDTNRGWRSISISSNGQYQSAVDYGGTSGYIYTSSDFGVTWIRRTEWYGGWWSISLSSTGQYQSAVIYSGGHSGYIYTSYDYGVSWRRNTNMGPYSWRGISISGSGQYQTAVPEGNTYLWTSSDYGNSWSQRTSWYGDWSSISLSSTGQYQTGVIQSSGHDRYFYYSSDYGVSWNRNTNSYQSWRSVAISSTGRYQTAVAMNGTIWGSNDFGVNWSQKNGDSRSWIGICMSRTGQYQTAVVSGGLIFISSNFGETWSAAANDSRSLGITYGKDATGARMWVATAGRRDRDVAASTANTMAYSYDGKLWRGITAAAGLSEQAWSVAYGKDGFGVGMWVAGGYDAVCGLKWSYDGITWNASTGASGASVWVGAAAGRRAITVYWNGSMWLASTSDIRNGEPRGTVTGSSIAANNASGVPGYLLYSYNGKNWLPVLAPNTYESAISSSAQPSIYSVLPNPAILDFGSFYDDQSQRGTMIANTTSRTVGAAMSSVPIENVNTIVPYGKGSLTTGQVPFIMGGDSGLIETIPGTNTVAVPITSELAASTTSLSTSTDGGITWRAVPNSTRVMTKVNKILCDETTQQIVAVGTGNYSVATSSPSKAADADGWTGVFGSRMTDTRAGMFERFGTGASWFSGAKMWIASGRAQSRRGSSLAVSVNGTVWQDAKIVSQITASLAGPTQGGGMVTRTTMSIATPAVGMNSEDGTPYSDGLYAFTTHTFTAASTSGATGPSLSSLRTAYSSTSWTQETNFFNSSNGIQLWTVPATGNYTIRCVGAGVPYSSSYTSNGQNSFQRGGDGTSTFLLSRGEIIRILVGQMPDGVANSNLGGGGGSFVVRRTQDPLIVVGGGGGRGASKAVGSSDAINSTTGQNGNDSRSGSETSWPGYYYGTGGSGGNGGNQGGTTYGGSGGGLTGNGANNTWVGQGGGIAFINGGMGGTGGNLHSNGGFGGGGGAGGGGSGAAGGGYSGGGQGALDNTGQWSSGGGGGSYSSVGFASFSANNNSSGFVIITANFIITPTTPLYYTLPTPGGIVPITSLAVSTSVVPYTAATTPLLTYTDSATAFSTQVSSVTVNSQYNRAVVGGSSVQFVAGGRGANGGLSYSNGGQNWTAASTGTSAVFQTPTNLTTRTGGGGFDASFGTVALTRRLTTPLAYPSGSLYAVAINESGQYQTTGIYGGQIWTSSDYGVNWTAARTNQQNWIRFSLSSSGQYQTAVTEGTNIWTSSDYGVTWTPRDSGRSWYGISLSSTGQYQTAVAYGGNLIYTSSDYGVNWVGRADGRSWYSVSISSTGQYQTAIVNGGGIWISSDYGVSWSQRDQSGRSWHGVSISSTGQYQTAVVNGGFIYVSSDFGITWTARMTDIGRNWTHGGLSISSTGQYQSATVNNAGTNGFGFIYTSNDFGITWNARLTDTNRSWGGISISGSGQHQIASVFSGTNLNNIYTSSNYGVSWVQRTTGRRTNAFTRIKSSASGQYQIATSGPVGNANGQFYISSDYGQSWMPRRGLGSWLSGAVSGSGAIMIGATSQQITLPYAIYVRTGGSIWRQFVPLLPANSSDNLQSWGPDAQFYDVNSGGGNEIAMQFSYFAGYWLNVNRAVVGQSLSVSTLAANGFLGTFTFTATSSNPVATYTGSLSGYNSTTYTLTPQLDGIAAGTSANSIPIRLSGALTYSPILYLDATNSSSYNGNTWANIGSLGGNVNMTYMGSFDSVDNGGSFNFNGSSNFGTLSVSSQTLTQATYVAVVKTNGKSGWAEILDLGNDNLFIGTGGSNVLYFYTPSTSSNYTLSPGVWYNIAFTISTSGALIFYVNGASVFSTTISTISKSGSLFGIGAGVNSTTSADEYWNGKISSLAVYNRVLSAQEISNLTSPRITIPDFWGTYGSMTSATSFTLNGFTLYSSIGTYSNEGISNLLTSGNKEAGFLGSSVTIGLTGPTAFKIDSIIWDNRGLTGSRKAKNYRFYGSNISYIGNISSALVSSSGTLLASGTFSSGSSSDTVTFSNPTYYTSYYFDILDNYGDGSIKVQGITINSGAPSNTALLNTSNTTQSNGFSLVRSTDYGTTFNDISGTTVTHPAYWRAISTTNSASNQTAVAYGGSIYRSSDTGATWSNTGITIDGSVNANTTARNWQDVAVSAETGAVQVTCVSGGYLYVSSNTGASWDSSGIVIDGSGSQLANRAWQAVAVSANGQYGLACVNSVKPVTNWINYSKNPAYAVLSNSSFLTASNTTSIINVNNYSTVQTLLGLTNMSQLKLQYKASIDGMTPNAFHSKVANIAPLFIVMRNTAGYIATAYSSIAFSDTSNGSTGFGFRYAASGTCWINNFFNPTGNGTYSTTKTTNQTNTHLSIYDHKDYGVYFGNNPTIAIGVAGPTSPFTTIDFGSAGPYTGTTGTILFGANTTTLDDFECYSIEAVDLSHRSEYSQATNKNSMLINSSNISIVKQLITDSSNNDTPQLKLIWKSTVDGWSASTWHTRVNGISPLLIVIRSTTGYIATAYTSIPYSTSNKGYNANGGTFGLSEFANWLNPFYNGNTGVYSTTKYGNASGNIYAIYDHNGYGPTFGGGHDLYFPDNMNSSSSYSNLGHSYTSRFPSTTPPANQSTLFGAYNFTPSEIECYMITIPNTVTTGRYGTPTWFPLTTPIFSSGDNINSPVNALKTMASTNVDGNSGAPGALITDLSQLRLIYRLSSEFDKKATTWYDIVSGVTQMLIVIRTSNGHVFTSYTGGQNFSGGNAWRYPSLNELFVSRFRDSSFTFSTTKYKNISTSNIILSAANYGPTFASAYYLNAQNVNSSSSLLTNDTIINSFSSGTWESGFTNTTLWGTTGNVTIAELECYSFTGGSGAGIAFDSVTTTFLPMYTQMSSSVFDPSFNYSFIYRSTNSCATWNSSSVVIDGSGTQLIHRAWQDVGMSANGKYQVACTGVSGNIFYSKDYGATWTTLAAAGYRAWSSVSLSENGNTISATTNDSSGGVWVYTMPDDQYYRPSILDNSGSTTIPATVRAVAYGNSGTGAALDGYWVAGADASANTLAYSTNGIDWTAVVGSKTTLFNSVNSVAYGVDTSGTPIWVAVGLPFVGSVVGSTAYSIAYSYNMTTWVGVSNAANFTGQGNHVVYGRDEFGAGMWVAVGQSDGALSANLGDSSLYNSNGATNTTIFYSYDGANWAAATGTGVFSVSGTDVTWGVDASGVATWVATGVGYTDQLTGIFTPGGQVAHSVNGRVWTPIRAPTAITPALSATTLPDTTRGSTMVAPPASTGFVTPTTNNIWRMLGGDIDGEATDDYSGYSVSMSADGMTVAVGATGNDGAASNAGHVRVYKYNPNKTVAQMNQSLPGFGPAAWDRLGDDIDGEAASEQTTYSRNSVVLSADGTTVAIGSNLNDGNGSNSGHVRIYKYTPSKTVAVTTQTDASFGPIGWNRLGADIDGEAANDESGWSVGLSADGNIVAIGAWGNDGVASDAGHVRVYKYTPSKTVAVTNQTDASFGPIGWNRLGADIDGEAVDDRSGTGLAISADGTTIAIGAHLNDGTSARTDDGRGQVRVYKYSATKTTAQTNQTLPNFGPIGWNRLGEDIDGDEYIYENYGPITLPTYNVLNFPVLNTIPNWEIDISFTSTSGASTFRGLIGSMRNAVDTARGWGIWVSSSNGIHYSHNNNQYDSFNGSVSLNTPYNLNVTRLSSTIHLRLVNLSTQAILTNSFSVSDPLGVGPVSIGGWPGAPQETFGGTISYVKVLTFFQSQSGVSVSLSADGNILAIAGQNNDGNSVDSGHVRVYKYNSSKVLANTLGPSGWDRLGGDIDGEAPYDYAGNSVSLSADGTVIAIGAANNDGPTGGDRGHVRVYKYNPSKNTAITNPSLPNFGPIGWDRIGMDIDGEAPSDYSGYSVSLSADGTTLAIGAVYNDGGGNNAGQVRVYKLDTFGAITYTSSNPSVAEIYGNTLLFIKEGASGTTTITATQAATPPFTLTPITVQGTLDVSGTTYTLIYNSIMTTFTPFTGTGASALTVAYGRAGSQGTGAPLWIVGGSGDNVFARSSRPSAITASTWTVDASNAVSVPFPVCNSLVYSNGVWVAGNNTDATNILARSVNGGVTWTPVTASSMSSILTGAAAVGANTSCNYSLAYADYSNDTNLRSWIAVQGTKNFMFEGGVSAVATVTPDISAAVYGSTGTRAWWVAGGVGLDGVASLGYTTDPNGAIGWTMATSAGIANLASITSAAFSPFTEQWVAVGAGGTGSLGTNILISDVSGITWTATSVATDATPIITLNTCIWNQLPTPATVSASGRWLVGGTRNSGGVNNVSVANSASLYISTDASGAASPWTPITGTGAILSQVYSLAYNGRVWIAAGVPATDGGSTSTLMRTTDPSGATGWVGITETNTSVGGFDTAARSITWNADDQMWIATGENTTTTGSGGAVDASFSSVIYSLDVSGGTGTWRSVRESNSICFSGEGTGVAFTGDRWFASGEGNKQIAATTGTNATTAATASWSTVSHSTTLTRASDIAYTGRRLIATGSGAGSTNGIIISTDNTGASWSAGPSIGFNDSAGGGTSINFEASYEGVGRIVATGRTATTNTLSVSTDGGSTWSAPSVQFNSTNTFDTVTQPLFTTGGNSVAYVGNDTLFASGGNDVHWTGKRWVATGRNSAATIDTVPVSVTSASVPATAPVDIINNNTAPVATSEDGIMWQCVRVSQTPNLSEGTFMATNSRIGSTPLIDSKITITDGGDTEPNMDYGGMTCGIGGSGTGVAAIDIIAELTPSSLAASSTGAVGVIGAAGNGGTNNIGNATIASFDTTAFTITTRPTPI